MAVADAPSRAAAGRREPAPAGALVLGADYRALGVVRSLGRRGVPVWVIRDGDDALAARSRYARRRLDWPRSEPREQQLAFLLGLADAGAEGFALIPSGDETAAFVARHHDALSARYAVTVPPWATMRFAYDKRLTYPLAAALGLDVPLDRRPARPRGPRRSRGPRDPVPGRPQAGDQGDVQPPDGGEGVARRQPRGAAAPLRRGVRARRARDDDGPGADPRRRRGAVLLRGAVPEASRSRRGRAPHAPVPRRLRPREHLRRDRRPPARSRRPPGAAARARMDRPRRGRVQARPARRPAQAARRQPARLGVAHALRPGRGRLPVPAVGRWPAARRSRGSRAAGRALGPHDDGSARRRAARSCAADVGRERTRARSAARARARSSPATTWPRDSSRFRSSPRFSCSGSPMAAGLTRAPAGGPRRRVASPTRCPPPARVERHAHAAYGFKPFVVTSPTPGATCSRDSL